MGKQMLLLCVCMCVCMLVCVYVHVLVCTCVCAGVCKSRVTGFGVVEIFGCSSETLKPLVQFIVQPTIAGSKAKGLCCF